MSGLKAGHYIIELLLNPFLPVPKINSFSTELHYSEKEYSRNCEHYTLNKTHQN